MPNNPQYSATIKVGQSFISGHAATLPQSKNFEIDTPAKIDQLKLYCKHLVGGGVGVKVVGWPIYVRQLIQSCLQVL